MRQKLPVSVKLSSKRILPVEPFRICRAHVLRILEQAFRIHLADTGDFGNLSAWDPHPGNTPKVSKSRPEIRARKAPVVVTAKWLATLSLSQSALIQSGRFETRN
jgi:hypothetical protein